jgi:hypothetical protein
MVSGVSFSLQILSVIGLALPALMILAEMLGPLPSDPDDTRQGIALFGIYAAFVFLILDGVAIVIWIGVTSFQLMSVPALIAGLFVLGLLSVAFAILKFFYFR